MRKLSFFLIPLFTVVTYWPGSTLGQDLGAPYSLQWPPAESPAVDLSFLAAKPAGAGGFLTVRNGHLATPDGQRFRIWGINLTAAATVPSKQEAPEYARFLAQHGINCVRLHFLDLPAPSGIVDGSRQDSRSLDPGTLDRLDFFIAQLKKNGIYIDLNLNVGRTYRPEDGVRDWEYLGFAKALTYFDDRLIELQKEYARNLLTHYNSYTGSRYRSEPAVAIIEFVNENSIVESWFSGRLLGENKRKNPGTWTDITASYAEDLTHRYNRWLTVNLTELQLKRLRESAGVGPHDEIPRLRPEQFKDASTIRFQTEASFYMELESRYFRMMKKFLREDIGARSLLIGTADHNHWQSGYPLLSSTRQLDIVDGHVYWQHPSYIVDPDSGRTTGFRIPNTPMVDDLLHSTVVQLSRSAVAGKPYTVSEVNHPFPNQFAAEGVPILTAYALLQDWDGIFWYTLKHDSPSQWEDQMKGHFDFAPDPIKMSQLAAGALTFLRGDVRRAEKIVPRGYSREEIEESIRQPAEARPYFTPGFSLTLPLQHSTRIVSFDQSILQYPEASAGSPLVSDTGELKWFFGGAGGGLVSVEAERTEALIGHLSRHVRLSHLGADLKNDFAAIALTSLDGKVLDEAGKILLNTASSLSNTRMEWNADRTSLNNWGAAPTRIEPLSGTVIIEGLRGAEAIEVMPLDYRGQTLGTTFRASRSEDGWRIDLGAPATPWLLLKVVRSD